MIKRMHYPLTVVKVILGSAVFGLGFDLFLEPNGLNAGGISGLSMALVHILGTGSVGVFTLLMNLPLFFISGKKIGRKFFVLSLLGMTFSSLFMDLFSGLPKLETEPLMGALYGGVLCGLGVGMVFATGGSTGGADIIVRLIKLRWRNVSIGIIDVALDLLVVSVTGIVFRDAALALYSGVAIFVSGQVIDAVVYRFDYSRVVLVISREYETITQAIAKELGRGVTYLHAEGSYRHNQTKVILTAVKKRQLAELKELVDRIDPSAFVIVQEAHQVLGDGFAHYNREAL